MAKQLSNPVAALISVPFQLNHDRDVGPSDGERWTLNVQPVVPITLSEDWNLISRTIVPLIDQEDVPAGEDETGLGDVLQSFFFSPVEPTAGGWILGFGPVLLLPTASDETLGAEQWGLGPTAVALRQVGPWTYGALVNHVWSVAGDDDRADVNASFVQPFLSYTTPEAWTYTLNSESSYDWEEDELGAPVHALVSKVLRVGDQLVSVGGGLRYWAEDWEGTPEGLSFRVFVTLLFPR
ncbi:MAG TPA: transporter [Planctomycetota bacterium]